MKKMVILILSFVCALYAEKKYTYVIEADDLAKLMQCVGVLDMVANNAITGLAGLGVLACDIGNRDAQFKACSHSDEISTELSKNRKAISDECTELTNEIVRKLKQSGQLPLKK